MKGLPNTAVFGAEGYLGKALYRAVCKVQPGALGTSRRSTSSGLAHFDLREPSIRCLGLKGRGVKAAIIAAGVSGGACMRVPQESRAVNVDGTRALIHELLECGILPVFLSTDNVFDGSKTAGGYDDNDIPSPVTEYGRQKAEVENALKESAMPFLVIRLSKVFGLERGDGTLLDELAGSMGTGQAVRAAYDQVFCPTLLDDVAGATLRVLASPLRGVVNVCSPEAWSRYDLAMALAAALGCAPSLVHRVSLDDVFPGEGRPRRTVLTCRRLEQETGFRFTPMETCIARIAGHYRSR